MPSDSSFTTLTDSTDDKGRGECDVSPLNNIDVAAKMHRHAACKMDYIQYQIVNLLVLLDNLIAIVFVANHDATCTWSGTLASPPFVKNPNYSCKVFLGGVPWDITAGMYTYNSNAKTAVKYCLIMSDYL